MKRFERIGKRHAQRRTTRTSDHPPRGCGDAGVYAGRHARFGQRTDAASRCAETGTHIILANTYHMLLRPGAEVVASLGDLHGLMGWDGPILTDSGGYQVFSLSTLNRIGDDGVEFASHIDGARITLNARIATETQNRLGADIIMCFDECTPWPCPQERLIQAVERTIRWAGQCKDAHAQRSADAVRNRSGRYGQRTAKPVCRGTDSDGL